MLEHWNEWALWMQDLHRRSYGAKFVENVAQAIARDVLCHAMTQLEQQLPHCGIVGHVHDEIILDCPQEVTLEDVKAVICRPPNWMPNLPLDADGYEGVWYRK